MTAKALFLDRDGVINIDKHYVYKKEDFQFVPGVMEVLRYFQEKGYFLIIITNQAGIARGNYTEEDCYALTEWMTQQFLENGINLTAVYFSPFHGTHGMGKYKKNSFCRKPNPGMILRGQQEFNIDLSQSMLVGDRESDIEAGINAGVKTNILLQDCQCNEIRTKANVILNDIKAIIDFDKRRTSI